MGVVVVGGSGARLVRRWHGPVGMNGSVKKRRDNRVERKEEKEEGTK
jgi:hypothetical protein